MVQHPQLKQAVALSESGRNDEAVTIIRQLASTGEPEALGLLAELHWRGGMVEQDLNRARTLYQYAGSLGNASAGIATTNLLASGVAGPRDWPQAIERLRAESQVIAGRRRTLELIEAMDLDGNGDPVSVPQGKLLSENPQVIHFERLLTASECAYLRNAGGEKFEPSMVYDQDRKLVRDTIRTSDGAAIHWLVEDPAIVALNRRIAAISGNAYEDGEPLALLRYSPGQEYRPHFDYVEGGNRRLQTALCYLNEDYDGGETEFVRTGLKVKGGMGDVILFRNDSVDGGPNPMSEHAGLPVVSGTKFLATRWIRESRWIP
ncbi:MAG TPA: 2OG-Fe(II) oxygenase [Sphingomicrobium sp.]|nr:2OG-Fe(II) oxygenase [Sphingomicrobium sp.]